MARQRESSHFQEGSGPVPASAPNRSDVGEGVTMFVIGVLYSIVSNQRKDITCPSVSVPTDRLSKRAKIHTFLIAPEIVLPGPERQYL